VARVSENLRWYTKALYGMDHVVRLGSPSAWDNASPCEGWTARHAIGHVIAIQRSFEALIKEQPRPMHPMRDTEQHAGADPAHTWAEARDAVLEALDHPGVLDRIIPSFRGDEPIDAAIGFNVIDTTIHTWDVARALGVDDRLDPGLVDRVSVLLAARVEDMRGGRGYAPAVDVPEGADPQTALLALAGRQA
jgi:uncharacterized protein (TIGR03086 family)